VPVPLGFAIIHGGTILLFLFTGGSNGCFSNLISQALPVMCGVATPSPYPALLSFLIISGIGTWPEKAKTFPVAPEKV